MYTLDAYAPSTGLPGSIPGGFPGGGPPGGVVTSPLDIPGLPSIPGLDWGSIRDWLDLGQRAVDLWNDIVAGEGGGLMWTGRYTEGRDPVNNPCPGTPSFDAVYRAVARMPQADVNWLLAGLGAAQGPTPQNRGDLLNKPNLPFWVMGVMGGKDCQHSTEGARLAWPEPYFPPNAHFVELVAQYGGPGSGGPILGGAGGNKVLAFLIAGAGAYFLLK